MMVKKFEETPIFNKIHQDVYHLVKMTNEYLLDADKRSVVDNIDHNLIHYVKQLGTCIVSIKKDGTYKKLENYEHKYQVYKSFKYNSLSLMTENITKRIINIFEEKDIEIIVGFKLHSI